MHVEPFKIEIPDSALADLNSRLRATRWPDDPHNDGWEYGTNLVFMKHMADYWMTSFDWRRTEERLNALPQFRADIDGASIHFLHIRGVGAPSAPLILTHGWPGSFVEMLEIAPLLTDPSHCGISAGLPFDLVIPSLPGFGFSAAPGEPGVNSRAIATM